MNEKIYPHEYTRDQAAKLIRACYNKSGANITSDALKKSILEDSLGELPDTWNVGLFRFLDESIYLIKFLGYFALAEPPQDNRLNSLSILLYQIEKNLLAVRVLSSHGLDASARQNLRSLFEMCQALCRCTVDKEFREEFSQPRTPETANKFWHQYISKEKTTKYLRRYNEENEHKCALVVEGAFDNASKFLGVSAHPNFFGWSIDFKRDWQTIYSDSDQESMFQFSSKQASEMVLVTSSEIAFLTIAFYAKKVSRTQSTLGLLLNNPMFKQFEGDEQKLEAISENSALMFMMLSKLIYRNRSAIDQSAHD